MSTCASGSVKILARAERWRVSTDNDSIGMIRTSYNDYDTDTGHVQITIGTGVLERAPIDDFWHFYNVTKYWRLLPFRKLKQ